MESGPRGTGVAERWSWTLAASVKDPDVEETIDRWVHRPLAFLLIRPLEHYATWITPTHVSLLSLTAGLGAGAIWLWGAGAGPGPLVLGALALFLSVILDCADGQLARLRGGGTHFGMMLDAMVDLAVALSTCVGLGATVVYYAEGWKWLLPVVAVVASTVVHVGLYDQFKVTYERRLTGRGVVPRDAPVGGSPIERLAAALRDLMYVRLFRWIRGSSREAHLTPAHFRRLFRPSMRLFAAGGIGTHFFIFYGVTLALAGAPHLIHWAAFVLVAGLQNLLTLMAVRSWARAEREARTLATAPANCANDERARADTSR